MAEMGGKLPLEFADKYVASFIRSLLGETGVK
jgi:hypothetical protein